VASNGSGAAQADGKNGNGNLVAEYLEALRSGSQGQVATVPYDSSLTSDLERMVAELKRQSVTVEDAKVAGEWIAAGGITFTLDAKWASRPGNVMGAVAKARSWDEKGRPEVGSKKTGHYKVTGREKYGSGDAKL
jgi:hypothetical protein